MPVQTTAGPVDAGDLGFTSMHEHVMMFPSRGIATLQREKSDLFAKRPLAAPHLDVPFLGGRERALKRTAGDLAAARNAGLRTIVDCSPPELGRDLAFVAEAARLAGVHVVVSTGLMGKFPASSAYFEAAGLGRAVDLFVRDIEQGIADTGIRAGAFKTALGLGNHYDLPIGFELPEGMVPDSILTEGVPAMAEFALRAAARTQARTGVLVIVHTSSRYRTGLTACDVLAGAGADLTRVSIHHAGETDDLDYLRRMLDRGVSLCMDPHRYAWRLPVIAQLAAEGYAGQMVLAVDAVLLEESALPDFWFKDAQERAQREPEWSPGYLPLCVVPGLLALGVSDEAIDLMTVANPARLLDLSLGSAMGHSYDLVIRGGMVIDGTGRARFRADVAVRDERIVAVGKVSDSAQREIDAEGCAVTPGFIDAHTHMDAQVMWDPLGTCSCWHGVTTVVMGNCGFTLAPARRGQYELVIATIERSEDISREALAEGVDWRWETFPEYLEVVAEVPKGINYVANIGHSALRTWAMGERAFEEEAGEADLETMAAQLRAALQAGAVGFSTSRSAGHMTADGRPVASRIASWHEIEALAGVMGAQGRGMLQITLPSLSAGIDQARTALRGLQSLVTRTGVAATFGVVPFRPRFEEELACIESVARNGGTMFAQAHSRGLTSVMSFRTTMPFDRLPRWQDVRSHTHEEQVALLRDPAVREELVASATDWSYGGAAVGAGPRPPDYDLMYAYDRVMPPYRTISDLATERRTHPVELIIGLAVETNLEQMFVQPFFAFDEADLIAIMKHPKSVMTLSDSGAHVSQIMDSSIQTHLLGYWVREREVFTLEEGVRMLTSVPALAWGLPQRGLLREGYIADLNVFDPAVVAPAMPTLEYDLPGGARRLKQSAVGFRATVVAGTVVHENGAHTGAYPGQLIRGPFAAPTI